MPKCKMTRPMFLTKFLIGEVSETELKKVLPEHFKAMYCCYSILLPFDFDKSAILSANYDSDGRTFCIETDSGKNPKKIKEQCHKTQVAISGSEYFIKVRAKEKFAYIEIIPLDDEE